MNPTLAPPVEMSSVDCCICLNEIAPCQALFLAPCAHSYHYKCVNGLLGAGFLFQCPMCRQVANLEASVADNEVGDDVSLSEEAIVDIVSDSAKFDEAGPVIIPFEGGKGSVIILNQQDGGSQMVIDQQGSLLQQDLGLQIMGDLNGGQITGSQLMRGLPLNPLRIETRDDLLLPKDDFDGYASTPISFNEIPVEAFNFPHLQSSNDMASLFGPLLISIRTAKLNGDVDSFSTLVEQYNLRLGLFMGQGGMNM